MGAMSNTQQCHVRRCSYLGTHFEGPESSREGSKIGRTGSETSPLIGFQAFISTDSATEPQNSSWWIRVDSAPKLLSAKSCSELKFWNFTRRIARGSPSTKLFALSSNVCVAS